MSDHGSKPEQPGDIPEVRDRWLLVAVAGALSFVAMLDMNIVNVALADIFDGLRIPAATAQWAVLGYQLPVVALLLPVGRWLDAVGTRSALLAATVGFTLGPALATAVWGLTGPDGGVRAGLALAAVAACLAVPLLTLPPRGPSPLPPKTTDAASAAHH
ncbi:MFS transporter [Streptomyces sp. F001]|uniref:MFS transporter n=1 Tax=Streptomyces sp. F001 TaxID=1510026 RepID=UPI001F0E0A83|nr:MFS transporter [Streptomyces sp. F001]